MTTAYQSLVADWRNCQRCRLSERRHRVVLARGQLPADLLFVGLSPGACEDAIGSPFVGPAGNLLNHALQSAFLNLQRTPSSCFTNLVACIPFPIVPTVVNVDRKDECDIPIGRGTVWGNPYIVGRDGNRDQVIAKYADALEKNESLLERLESLAGKRLGCHCKPLACHGDALVQIFKRRLTRERNPPPASCIRACAPRLKKMLELCKPKLVITVGVDAEEWLPKIAGADPMRQFDVCPIMHPSAILQMDVSQRGLAILRSVMAIQDAVSSIDAG